MGVSIFFGAALLPMQYTVTVLFPRDCCKAMFNEREADNLRADSGLLSRLGVECRTDKSCHNLTDGLNYLDVYEPYFSQFSQQPVRLLEIGVRDGSSLRLWQRYFVNAEIIVGIDIDPGCEKISIPKCCIEIGDQADPAFLRKVTEQYGPFDIVIDDGSHINADIVASFEELWAAVSANGIYVIEDLNNSYGRPMSLRMKFGAAWRTALLGRRYPVNRRSQITPFFERLIQAADDPKNDVLCVHFWGQLCIVRKAAAS